MSLFTATAAYNYQELVAAGTGSWPTILNAGLIGRWEITNNASWPGSGTTIYNLSTSSVYTVSSASIVNGYSTDTTNGIVLNGSSSRVDFGVLSTYNSGSYNLNEPLVAASASTIVYVCNFVSASGASSQQVGMSAWNDYFADTGQSKYLLLHEMNNFSGQLERSVVSNVGFNPVNVNSYITNNAVKFYGYRVAWGTNGYKLWVGTSNFSNATLSGTGFSSNPLVSRNVAWTFGARGTTTLNSFQNYMKGNFYAAYMWNRSLSDSEMQELQAYTNTYVKTNS